MNVRKLFIPPSPRERLFLYQVEVVIGGVCVGNHDNLLVLAVGCVLILAGGVKSFFLAKRYL